jgi:hypothetical protein
MLLSHYTTRSGLEGIATSQTLRATSFMELNDTSEFFFAWSMLLEEATKEVVDGVPASLRPTDISVDAWSKKILIEFKQAARKIDPQGHVFVFSFARSVNEEQERNGILTLWRDYTKCAGYCLQFQTSNVEHFLQLEQMRGSYFAIGLLPVRYGVDKEERHFKELVKQWVERLALHLSRPSGAMTAERSFEGIWADSAFLRKLTGYCAEHKHPSFEDEREVRIFACPAARAEARPFTGIAGKKEVLLSTNGKHYIELGEYWQPSGLRPERIIIGPLADPNIGDILARFDRCPEVVQSEIPIAAVEGASSR